MAYILFQEREFDVKAERLASAVWSALGDALAEKMSGRGSDRIKMSVSKVSQTSKGDMVVYGVVVPVAVLGVPGLPSEAGGLNIQFRAAKGKGRERASFFVDKERGLPVIEVNLSQPQLQNLTLDPKKTLANPNLRSIFAHEFVHFLDWARRKETFFKGAGTQATTPKGVDIQALAKTYQGTDIRTLIHQAWYVNQKIELLAWVTQRSIQVLHDAQKTKKKMAELMAGGLREFVRRVQENDGTSTSPVYPFLTPDNKRRWLKHVTTFWYQHPELGKTA